MKKVTFDLNEILNDRKSKQGILCKIVKFNFHFFQVLHKSNFAVTFHAVLLAYTTKKVKF